MKTLKLIASSALFASLALVSNAQAQTKPGMAKPIGLVGIVAGSFSGPEFILRANGQTYRVRPLSTVALKSIRGGDRVRVWGRLSGLRLNYANVRVLQVSASSNPTDFNPAPNETVEKKPSN